MRTEQVEKFVEESLEKLQENIITEMTLFSVYRMGIERGVKWADLNPAEDYIKLITEAQDKMGVAVVALDYIANSIPGPDQTFEIENKNAAVRALNKIRGLSLEAEEKSVVVESINSDDSIVVVDSI